jgi:alkanesulfonate monooxygenase SsuD/methylene tetrahydromethanopterin reductase-like flavin-dependent oxidoreductase (luciferase family)
MQQPLREIDLLRASAMKEIWTKKKAEYHGEFVNFDPMIARPKPVQKPHPPIHVGGAFPHGARRAIRYCNGWIPGGDIREVLPKFRDMAREGQAALLRLSVPASTTDRSS